ncbi:MAG: sigma 54-interacting transcriptional regulator [Myxococcota bacterium]
MAGTLGITQSIDGRGPGGAGSSGTRPQLILAIECSRPTALSARYDLGDIAMVRLGRGRDRLVRRSGEAGRGELRIGVPDRLMSSRHARIEYSFGRWMLHDTESKNGSLVNGEPVHRAQLRDGDLIELGHTFFLFREAVQTGERGDLEIDEIIAPGLVTLVPDFALKLNQICRLAASEISMLLQGESGTGKEVVARAIHGVSGRPGAFIAVNCGAIPANLVESELFGHKKGAFSGAVDDREGMVRASDRGTLFLDEIGDLPAPSQAALLRVLQEREVQPVGATRPVKVDLRVLAATHRDLDGLVASGGFRHDLFARLAGFRLTLPRLAERREDLGLLIGVLYSKITDGLGPGLEPDATRLLFRYPWPLNIRELEQTLTTAVVLAGDRAIEVEHLPEHLRDSRLLPTQEGALSVRSATGRLLSTDDMRRRDELVGQLRRHHGNVSAIARAMGKDRKQIQRWLKRYGLRAEEFRS